MAKYLIEAHYTAEGAKAVAREGGATRRAAVAKMIESLGGKVEAFISHSATPTPTPLLICQTALPRSPPPSPSIRPVWRPGRPWC
jgi:hypothetical protein